MGIAKRALDYAQSADAPRAKMLKCGLGSQFGACALTSMTSVVADTGDFEKTKNFRFEDTTTTPTLLLEVVQMPQYEKMLQRAIEYAKEVGLAGEDLVIEVCDKLAVSVGCEILRAVQGNVSAQLDANLSSNTAGSVAKAKKLIRMFEDAGVSKDRVVIKLGSTWQSMMACRQLQKEGIKCNTTMNFSFPRAVACADADDMLVSHFVARILDWRRKNTEKKYTTEEDPGVLSVRKIYQYYKKFGYTTIEMGAAFRNAVEILEEAGSDKLTFGPQLLRELQKADAAAGVEQKLDPEICKRDASIQKLEMSENIFRCMMNEDLMSADKLHAGAQNVDTDLQRLKEFVRSRIN